MIQNQKMTWKEAFFNTPGPRRLADSAVLIVKGFLMGIADVIPGVSGGTIALIVGIYENILNAVQSIDLAAFKLFFTGKFKQLTAKIHLRFLLVLFLGINSAVIGLSRVMNYLLNYHPVPTWAFFFGLIGASIFIVAGHVQKWTIGTFFMVVLGAVGGFFLVGLIPLTTPETWWFIFISGFIAICAMILPGISGAFILLIIGKYEFITASLKNPFILQNFITITIFSLGCAVGLGLFTRFLNFLLKQYHSLTMAFLTGLMAGSLRKIWPWKFVLESRAIGSKIIPLRTENVLPNGDIASNWMAFSLILMGLCIVFALHWIAKKHKETEQGEYRQAN